MGKSVLVVCSGNHGNISAFIEDQIESLKPHDIDIHLFKIQGNGVFGYLKNLPRLYKTLDQQSFDLIHAYYGLSGLFANFQRRIPVVTTFLGSDVNTRRVLPFSFLTSRLSRHTILCHRDLNRKLFIRKSNHSVINFGLDTSFFKPMNIKEARRRMKLDDRRRYVLFASSSGRKVKNYGLAQRALQLVHRRFDVVDIQLGGYTKTEVRDLINAVDLLLITSKSETGPVIAKEAMACNIPIVSTDVGDVNEIVAGAMMCFVCNHDEKEIADAICRVLESGGRSSARDNILGYDLTFVAKKIAGVYDEVLSGFPDHHQNPLLKEN